MSPLRNKTALEITAFIRGWLEAIDAHNDKLNDQNAVFRVLRDILEYACPNEFRKTDDKQETAENVNCIPTYKEVPTYCSNAVSTSLGTIDERELCIIGNDIKKRTINVKENVETSEDYNMTFEDAQAYCSKRGIDVPWNDGDIFIDERDITRTVGNVLKWADEHPKVELPKWKRMPLSDQSYVDDFACVTHIITSEKNGISTSVEAVQKGNYYIPMFDLEKFSKEK